MTSAAHRSHKKAAPKPEPVHSSDYAPGYFTRHITAHNWPPRWEPTVTKANTLARSDTRANGGFDRHALNLPGAAPYTGTRLEAGKP